MIPDSHPLARQDVVAWDELREESFIVSHGGPGSEIQDYLIRMLSRSGFRPRIDVHDVSRENLVALGFGLTLTSTSTLRQDVEGICFRPIAGERDVLVSSAVWSATNANPALSQLLAVAERLSKDWPSKVGRVVSSLAFMIACSLAFSPVGTRRFKTDLLCQAATVPNVTGKRGHYAGNRYQATTLEIDNRETILADAP